MKDNAPQIITHKNTALIIFFLFFLNSVSTIIYVRATSFEIELGHFKQTLITLKEQLEKESKEDTISFELINRYAKLLQINLSVIGKDGRLIVTTKGAVRNTNLDYSFFRDVSDAIKGELSWVETSDYNETEKKVFLSVPLLYLNQINAVLRAERTSNEFRTSYKPIIGPLIFTSLLLITSLLLFERNVRSMVLMPLMRLHKDAREAALSSEPGSTDFSSNEFINQIAQSIKQILKKYAEKSRELDNYTSEYEKIFSCMREGIILIDQQQKILKINKAAYEMMGTANKFSHGKSVEEIVRNVHLQNHIKEILENKETREFELELHENKHMVVQVYGTIINSPSNGQTNKDNPEICGAGKDILMIVLNDITQLKKLENVRKDFVANVSHELKTPITAIQGFIETLLDGAMNSAEEASRFLEIIRRQTERLNFIVNDLLILAGLENNAASRDFHKEKIDLKKLIDSVLEICQVKASKKNIIFRQSGIQLDYVYANHTLLEQALINLVDNSIKYSSSNKEISFEVYLKDDKAHISVIDQGIGIEKNQLDRIFERFYRVDQARSGEEGSSGLGLAIVRHIALLHEGNLDVESEINKGSKFTISLPHIC